MNVTVCIGSFCSIKGSHTVVEKLEDFVAKKSLADKVHLAGAFCMGKCQSGDCNGVCVDIDGVSHSVSPDTADEFFSNEILAKLN